MSSPGGEGPVAQEHGWLYNHIGRISGVILGLVFIAFLAFLAVAGYEPALALLVVLVAGVLLVSLGSQLRGPMRGH